MDVQPYLFFDGRCEEAVDYYRRVLGAEVKELMRWSDNPNPEQCMVGPANMNKIMHMRFEIGETTILASDGRCEGKPNFQGFSLTIQVPDAAEAERKFNALADGGQVQMPLAKTFFSPSFGMVADRFGVGWMIWVAP